MPNQPPGDLLRLDDMAKKLNDAHYPPWGDTHTWNELRVLLAFVDGQGFAKVWIDVKGVLGQDGDGRGGGGFTQ
jgi:hypothetical protein